MLDDGLFERFPCDAIYGMHNMPGIALGRIGLRPGPLMAGSGRWVVRFCGTGGHGGNSAHMASDLAVALAFFIQHLQAIVSRNVPAIETAVISVGHIQGGAAEATNVMPAELVVGGTMRAFTPEVSDLLERRIREVAALAAAGQGATAAVELHWNAIPLLNAVAQAAAAGAAAVAALGQGKVDAAIAPVTAGEDFAYMLARKPGAMVFPG